MAGLSRLSMMPRPKKTIKGNKQQTNTFQNLIIIIRPPTGPREYPLGKDGSRPRAGPQGAAPAGRRGRWDGHQVAGPSGPAAGPWRRHLSREGANSGTHLSLESGHDSIWSTPSPDSPTDIGRNQMYW